MESTGKNQNDATSGSHPVARSWRIDQNGRSTRTLTHCDSLPRAISAFHCVGRAHAWYGEFERRCVRQPLRTCAAWEWDDTAEVPAMERSASFHDRSQPAPNGTPTHDVPFAIDGLFAKNGAALRELFGTVTVTTGPP